MALIIKLCRSSTQSLLRNKGYLCNVARYASDDTPPSWNYLWEPGEYSKKAHDKIAEKYHLHPKDYKPLATNCDYPDLPMIGAAAKDPYYPYDLPAIKKNYHETMHHQFDITTEDRFNFGQTNRIDSGVATLICVTVFGTFAAIFFGTKDYCTFQPMMEKQYPYRGKAYYTFESAEKKI
ncbi:NADH dehydrogenase [ubiquinone] 1 beta subcomplex subunit 8, mitochondrial [Harpegnathos saltator]|uniref:NADH dehydrogenase [ubiquinone] 1 beta subcomplex subunit 8, mitochondrial n=1 Tax=Harpegnathos saltator TaxID=610380 RepID=UPI000590BDD4|nr:NADH dehydrogenase [ubiquinone] 1 beta subcomplex subunit 8, mitochondrial [Harpegnathos saltator]